MADLQSLKRTKILATIGPASRDPEVLQQLITSGVNGVRLNMSHGSHEVHGEVIKLVRTISKRLGKPIAVVADLQGPKIRLGALPDEGITLASGDVVKLIHGDAYDEGGPLPVQHDLSPHVKIGQPIFLRDGVVRLKVTGVKGAIISAVAENTGTVFSKQGINLPETNFDGDILTKKDIADLKFAAESDVDYVALSFVQTADDIGSLRARMRRLKAECGIIAKIETKAATNNLEPIIALSDGVMVARGDLAIETRPEQVPVFQKRIIDIARGQQKFAIVATQMLESMISSPQPTRAEVSDVAVAVVQGADAVMLSGESAMGQYPIETVEMMRRVIIYTEMHRMESITAQQFGEHTKRNAISAAAITVSKQIEAKLILAETASGATARTMCSFRPETLVVAVTNQLRTFNQLALTWGARSYMIKNPANASAETLAMLHEEHNVSPNDVVIRVSGGNPGVSGGIDTIRIETV